MNGRAYPCGKETVNMLLNELALHPVAGNRSGRWPGPWAKRRAKAGVRGALIFKAASPPRVIDRPDG
jgi:hypothetical protein